MKVFKTRKAQLVGRYVGLVIGALIYACGQNIFIRPMQIPMGGAAGISLVINFLTGFPVGMANLLINIPLYYWGYKSMGRKFFVRTVVSTASAAVFLDLLNPVLPAYEGDMLISALYGGVVMGIGFGIIFRMGGTSGGTDIVAKYLNEKKDIQVGSFNLVVNLLIIIISSVIYGRFESAFYAVITSFVSASAIDRIVYGSDRQKKATIITSKPEEVSDEIMKATGHGVTALRGEGMDTHEERTVLLCVVGKYETGTLKRVIETVDPRAFIMLGDVNEVLGKGFKSYGQ